MNKVKRLINSKKIRIIVSLCLIGLYYGIFSQVADLTDSAKLASDTWSYQSMGVNFAKGHGFHTVGGLEEYEVYKFSDNPSPKHLNYFNLFAGVTDLHRLPGYPFFIGVIYSVFGVNPLIAKNIQLLLIIIVASSLPLLGFYIWKHTGFISGLLASAIFITYNYSYAELIMTEPLVIFTLFIVLVSYLYFESKKSSIASILLGIVFGISMLVKGSFGLIPVLFFIYYAYRYFVTRDRGLIKSLFVVTLFAFLMVMPWSIFASYKVHGLKSTFQEIKVILMDDGLTYTEKQKRIDDISPQVGKGFAFDGKLSQEDRALLRDSIFPAVQRNGVFLFSNQIKEIRPLEKLALIEQILATSSFVMLRVILPKNGLLGVHNEFVANGKWNPVWRVRKNSFYNNDNLAGSPDWIRVVNFYVHHPALVFTLARDKIVRGFTHFIFLWVALLLFIIETFGHFAKSYSRNNYVPLLYTLITLPILSLPFFVTLTNENFIFIFPPFLIALLVLRRTNTGSSLFSVPVAFYVIFFNYLLITIIAFGRERYTAPMDFIIILASINYLITYLIQHLNIKLNLIR